MTPDIETGTSTVHSPGLSRAAQLGNTHVRHKVLAMTMALGAITYLDRVSISVTRPYIARDLNLSPTQMGYVFSAFYVAYALFVVRVHRADGLRVQLFIAGRDSVSVRHW